MNVSSKHHGNADEPLLKQIAFFAALGTFVCSAFTIVASLFLLVAFKVYPGLLEDSLFNGLLLRTLLFSVLASVAVWAAVKLRPDPSQDDQTAEPNQEEAKTGSARLAFPTLLLFMFALVAPNLDDYPWTAPDETHHLVVAKNIAVHGRYASGHPDVGFKDFDTFDSVGAPVLLPVAAALKIGGVSLFSARCVMVLYWLLFGITLYRYARFYFDNITAAASALFATMAFSSIYLSRTLYGEVPALFYCLVGLTLWRAALHGRGRHYAFFAGIAFGLSVLTKTIMLLTVFPVLGTLLYDRLTRKEANLYHVLLPAVGVILTIAAWWGVQALAAYDVAEASEGTIAQYKNYLLFGIEGAGANIKRILFAYPLAHVVCFASMLATVPIISKPRHDLSSIVFFFVPPFYAYWWTFFTPGQLPRYLWISYALLGAIVGIAVVHLLKGALKSTNSIRHRIFFMATALLAIVPYVHWTWGEAHEVYTNQEMRDDKAVAEYVAQLPDDTTIATTFYPLRGTLHFLTSKWIDGGENPTELLKTHSVVLVRRDTLHAPAASDTAVPLGKDYLALSDAPRQKITTEVTQ